MHTSLQHRGYDAANLAVVAARHLPADDGVLAALREGSRTLLSGTEDMALLLSADDEVTNAAMRLADSLPALSTVQDMSDMNALQSDLDAIIRRIEGA